MSIAFYNLSGQEDSAEIIGFIGDRVFLSKAPILVFALDVHAELPRITHVLHKYNFRTRVYIVDDIALLVVPKGE